MSSKRPGVVSCVVFMLAACQVQSAVAKSSIGIGVGSSQSEYKDYDSRSSFLPLIHYEDEQFYFHGASGGIFIQKNDVSQLTFGATAFLQEFDPADTDDAALRLLDKRRYTMMLDMGYKTKLSLGQIKANLGIDVLDRSDSGLFGVIEYQYPLRLSKQLLLVPSLGAEWRSSDLNQYYYGVSAAESSRSGVSAYSPDDSITPHLGVMVNYQMSDRIAFSVATKYQWLPSEMTDSPMVDQNHKLSAFVSANYVF